MSEVMLSKSRAREIGLAALMLAIGVAAGYVGALKLTPRSNAECAPPAAKEEGVMSSQSALRMAELAMQEGDLSKARAFTEASIKAHGSPSAYMLLGKLALKSNYRLEAMNAFRCVVLLDPNGDNARLLERRLAGAAQEAPM